MAKKQAVTVEQRLREIFDLEQIKNYAETHINQTEWIEDVCGEKRRILVVATIVDGAYGAYIPGIVLDLFGRADGYDLEDPYNYEKNETIYDALEDLENEVNDCLNQLLQSKGTYYIGYHDADGSYCLFYEELAEEEINIDELAKKYGLVEYKGKKYILTDYAEPTSRLLPDYQRGCFEMFAPAVDEEGNEYVVYWIFTDDGRALDKYDYNDVDRVEIL